MWSPSSVIPAEVSERVRVYELYLILARRKT